MRGGVVSMADNTTSILYSEALLRMTEAALAAYIANPGQWNFKDVNVGEAAARAARNALTELNRLMVNAGAVRPEGSR